jgi:hypothetical protein
MLSLWHDGCRTRAAAQRQVSTPLAPAMEPQLHQAHA